VEKVWHGIRILQPTATNQCIMPWNPIQAHQRYYFDAQFDNASSNKLYGFIY
jgi:hypothetical protein